MTNVQKEYAISVIISYNKNTLFVLALLEFSNSNVGLFKCPKHPFYLFYNIFEQIEWGNCSEEIIVVTIYCSFQHVNDPLSPVLPH